MRSWALLFLLAAALAASAQEARESATPNAGRRLSAQPGERGPENGTAIMVPAGTRVPVRLESPISTKDARAGDPVYARTAFPVTVDDRMAIPAGTYVQGVISHIKRAGRIKGRAEVLFHFTTLVFPSGYTVSLPGSVEGAPGQEKQSVKDSEGTIQHDPEKGKDIGKVAGTAATGATIGAVAAQSGKGAGIGAGVGGATGLAIAMLTRGSDVRLNRGTTLEMVLGRALPLNASKIRGRP